MTKLVRRTVVFMQPGEEVYLVPSPLVGSPKDFTKHMEPVGRIVMNAKHSLWFITTKGKKIHLAKAPAEFCKNGKRAKPTSK